jgi:hypothetical protein
VSATVDSVAKGGTGQIIGKRVNGEGNGKASIRDGSKIPLGNEEFGLLLGRSLKKLTFHGHLSGGVN